MGDSTDPGKGPACGVRPAEIICPPARYPRGVSKAPPPPQLLVIFGASGDLARRKLLPALYNLAHDGLLPTPFAVVGYGRKAWDDANFRIHARRAVEEFSRRRIDEVHWQRFAEGLFYVTGDYNTGVCYETLDRRLSQLESTLHTLGRRLYYCATPSKLFALIVEGIGAQRATGPSRVVLEKPIGHDLASARSLDRAVRRTFSEPQIFRIDHYLGKDTLQNILVFRFANPLIERIWSGEAIEHMQVTVAETLGVEHRGGYYETAGAMRDMVQSHLLQVLAYLTMERPARLGGAPLRDAKAALLDAVRPFDPTDVVRGQYQWGVVEGHEVPGYREEEDVARDSSTETYVAVRAWVDNDRWRGVPFLMRTGKRMAHRVTEVVVELRDPGAGHLFAEAVAGVPCNRIMIQLQPDPGISIAFRVKEPGLGPDMQTVPMRFSYGTAFAVEPPEAYEHLLLDALAGDETLFLREDVVERAWEIVAPAIREPGAIHPYPAGTWGPSAADQLTPPHKWHLR